MNIYAGTVHGSRCTSYRNGRAQESRIPAIDSYARTPAQELILKHEFVRLILLAVRIFMSGKAHVRDITAKLMSIANYLYLLWLLRNDTTQARTDNILMLVTNYVLWFLCYGSLHTQ